VAGRQAAAAHRGASGIANSRQWNSLFFNHKAADGTHTQRNATLMRASLSLALDGAEREKFSVSSGISIVTGASRGLCTAPICGATLMPGNSKQLLFATRPTPVHSNYGLLILLMGFLRPKFSDFICFSSEWKFVVLMKSSPENYSGFILNTFIYTTGTDKL